MKRLAWHDAGQNLPRATQTPCNNAFKQPGRSQNLRFRCVVFSGVFWHPLIGVCPLVLQKHVPCIPFLCGWQGSCGQQIQANAQGRMKQNASSGAQSGGSETKLEVAAPATPTTRKPGHSAHAGSTQGVFS